MPAWTGPDGMQESPVYFSSQDEYSDEMPEGWTDGGPGPFDVPTDYLKVGERSPRSKAWGRRQLELGRKPICHTPRERLSAMVNKYGVLEGPYEFSSLDEFSDECPDDWEEDKLMDTESPQATLMTQTELNDNQPRLMGKRKPDDTAVALSRVQLGDFTLSASTPSQPRGKTIATSSSPASLAILGLSSLRNDTMARAARHLRILDSALAATSLHDAQETAQEQSTQHSLHEPSTPAQGSASPPPI